MSCCGKQRQRFSTSKPSHSHQRERAASQTQSRPSAYAYFQYTGPTGLSVRAPSSGSRYRFEGSGAVVAVDPRDRRALAALPQLRQVRAP